MRKGSPGDQVPFVGDMERARMALARRRRRRRIRQAVAVVLVGSASLGVIAVATWGAHALFMHVREQTGMFQVRRVDVGRTQWVPPWDVADAARIVPGDDLLDISPEAIEARVEENPWVRQAHVWKRGRTLRVEVSERSPVALWLGEELLELAADGTVLGPAPERSGPEWPLAGSSGAARGLALPLLTGVELGALEPGNVIQDAGARQALLFLARLRSYDQAGEAWISEVWAGESGNLIAVTLELGIPVRVGDGVLTPRKIRALRSVLDRVHEEDTPPTLVDARFRHQVVVKTG